MLDAVQFLGVRPAVTVLALGQQIIENVCDVKSFLNSAFFYCELEYVIGVQKEGLTSNVIHLDFSPSYRSPDISISLYEI
jgi:hypothetical protein